MSVFVAVVVVVTAAAVVVVGVRLLWCWHLVARVRVLFWLIPSL